jgi:hypothetical protein
MYIFSDWARPIRSETFLGHFDLQRLQRFSSCWAATTATGARTLFFFLLINDDCGMVMDFN